MVFCFEVSSRGRVRTNGSTPVSGKRKFAGQAPAGLKLKDDSSDDKGIVESALAAIKKVQFLLQTTFVQHYLMRRIASRLLHLLLVPECLRAPLRHHLLQATLHLLVPPISIAHG